MSLEIPANQDERDLRMICAAAAYELRCWTRSEPEGRGMFLGYFDHNDLQRALQRVELKARDGIIFETRPKESQ